MKKLSFLFLTSFSFIFCSSALGQGGVWTWVSGSNATNAPPLNGTQGTPSVNNRPADAYEPCEWKDNQGNFWVYGGGHNGNSGYDNLFKYNPVTNEWTWVKGSGIANQAAVYGTQGVPAPGNTPGQRELTVTTWVDAAGNLWLFGGTPGAAGILNDLWKYNIGTNNWTWMSGSNTTNSPGVYGIQGVPSPTNVPGARNETCSSWSDASNNLWLFGGNGMDSVGGTGGQLNDLWKYNISTNQWTWMKGSPVKNQASNYGIMGVPSASNTPGGRLTYTKWKDLQGNFWIMGGRELTTCYNNTVWKYDISTNNWTWMQGPNTCNDAGNYTAPVCDTTGVNRPRCRMEHRASATDNLGNFWLFGGASNAGALMNDLWIFNPQTLKWKYLGGLTSSANYGTIGVEALTNMPPGRYGALAWWGNNNKFYMFGGTNDGFAANNFSDLWTFDPRPTTIVIDTNCVPVTPTTTGVTATTSSVNPLCFGLCTGTATANPSGGTSPYTYVWTGGQTTQTITGLCAGTYTVTVTDAVSGTTTATVTITQPTVISVTASSTPTGCTTSTGTATATPSGGTSPYTYNWSAGGQTTQTATGLGIGTYTVTITDDNGCTKTQTVNVISSNGPTASIASSVNPLCNGGTNGTATAGATGGTSPYTYLWSNGQTTITATNLSATTYTVTVTDAGGCTDTQTITLTQPAAIAVTTSSTPAGCTASTGTATANPSGGTSPYTYSWTGGQTTQTATGLGAGTYTVTVTDANGCTKTQTVNVTISASPTANIASSVNPLCNGGTNGTATASATGGTSPYTYMWSNGQITITATNLSATTYTVTVTDAGGCTDTQTITLTQPTAIAVTTSSTPSGCTTSTGTATATPSGGTPGYTYTWSPSGQTTQTATGLGGGTYSVTVTDVNGCTKTQTVTVTSTGAPTVTLASQTNVSCNGGTNGTATAGATGGTSPYTYMWSNGQTTITATNLSATTYTVTVTGANGCTATKTVTITQPTVISITTSATSTGCTTSTGTATATPSGGTAGYTYSWSPSAQTTQTATGLGAGTYTVTVKDANLCTKTKTVTVTSSNPVTLTTTSIQTKCTGNTGTATANPANGAAPYTYIWSNSQTTQTATGLGAGTYTVTVRDANGCTKTQTVTVTQFPGPAATASATPGTIAPGGSAQLTATGGGTYQWQPATGLSCTTCANPEATPTGTATYCVIVTDTNGCTGSACTKIILEIPCAEIFVPNAFSPDNNGRNDLECVLGNCIEEFHFAIYDRWGQKVFETTDQKMCWDGKFKGKLMNTAVFVYYLKASLTNGEKISRSGNVSLMR